jgi:hypothetical protein
MLVALVHVAACGIGLPDLDELAADRPAVTVPDTTGHHHPLPDRIATHLDGEIRLQGVDIGVTEDRRDELNVFWVDSSDLLDRVPEPGAAIRREVEPGLRPAGASLRVRSISSESSSWLSSGGCVVGTDSSSAPAMSAATLGFR